jgi:hypothetical protein
VVFLILPLTILFRLTFGRNSTNFLWIIGAYPIIQSGSFLVCSAACM